MPFFDYECTHCDVIMNDVMVKKYDEVVNCVCGEQAKKLVLAPAGHMFAQHAGTDRGRVMSFRSDKTKRK